MIGERTTIYFLWHNKDRQTELISKRSTKCRPNLTECLERSRSFPNIYIMSKQRIWSTGIIVAWTLAIHICTEWLWEAPLMSKVPAPPHHPGNLCYHPSWWNVCWCYYRWWFRMCCLINELHIGPSNPAWTWRTKSSRLGMVTDINYVSFYVKFIQPSPVYWFHQSIKVLKYLW